MPKLKRGRHSPAGYKYLQSQKKKKKRKPREFVSLRTSGIQKKLKMSGLSADEIRQLTGK